MPTIGEMIDKCLELEAYVEQEQNAFDVQIKPYKEAVTALKQACLGELQRTGQQNAKSENGGTAYQQTILSVKVDNQDTLRDFVVQNNRWDMVSLSALKDGVKAYREQFDKDPPGVVSQPITKCNIRRS